MSVNTSQDAKILAMSKLKVFAENNFNVAQVVHFLFDMVVNILGKGENVSYLNFFSFSHDVFEKLISNSHR